MIGKTVTRSFTFNTDDDARILEALEAAGPRRRSALVRQALKEFLDRKEDLALDRDDIIEACRQAIRIELAGKLVQAGDSELIVATAESPAAKNLARLSGALEEW